MDKFISKVTRAKCSAQIIYNRFESLENLAGLVQHEKIEHVEASHDECHITVKGIGAIGIKVVNREPFKTLKFSNTEATPLEFTLWIQLVEVDSLDTRIRLTLHAKIPMMIRLLIKGKLQTGLDQAAEQIASAFSL